MSRLIQGANSII